MGQKVNPHGARVGVILDWSTKWYAGKKDFSNNLIEDYKLRQMLKEKLYQAGISHIDISRTNNRLHVIIFTAKPGIVIGRGGAGAEAIKNDIAKLTGKPVNTVQLDIMEIKHPDTNAQLVAENIASQLERRIAFRRAMKLCMGRAMRMGAKGIKAQVGGRLAGADIARSESYHEGTIPLQTLRADIDYGFAEADTTYGKIGVKVWIYKGEVLKGAKPVEPEPRFERRERRAPRTRREGGNK